MTNHLLMGIFLLFALLILSAGCSEPPVKKPVVTVSDISLADVSFQTMTVNATITIFNPNPVGATLSRVTFDVYYFDESGHYLGHGEQKNINVKENGNTSVVIPVTIGTVPAVQAVGSLVKNGDIILRVNGTAAVDIKVTDYEIPFEESRKFQASEFAGLVPEVSVAGTSVNVMEKLGQAQDILHALTG